MPGFEILDTKIECESSRTLHGAFRAAFMLTASADLVEEARTD